MTQRSARFLTPALLAITIGALPPFVGFASAQSQDTPPQAPPAAQPETKPVQTEKPEAPPKEVKVLTLEDMLRAQIADLKNENQSLREQLAQAQLDASQAQRELDELRQFMADHNQLGEDFEKYQGMLDIAERQARQQRAEEYRAKVRQQDEERKARYAQAKAERAAQQAEQDRLRRYEKAGFYPVGQGVYVSAMAYQYKSRDVPDTSYRFAPLIRFDGTFFFTRYWQIDYDKKMDYSSMTFSGSVVNSADEPRNIGVAISFFDEYGRQVGGETVEIENARTDAPYPFTHTLDMALDRAFSSYRVIVLYSDPVEKEADKSASRHPDNADVIGPCAAVQIAAAD